MEKTFDFADDDLSSYIDSDGSSSLEYVENKNFLSKTSLQESLGQTKAAVEF